YISPEQARDPRNADIRSDLYSLGCTLFYMLTGQPPFPEGTVLQKLLRHQGDDAPDPRDLRGDLPEDVAEIVRRLLAKLPEDRYPEPESLIKALLIVARRVGLPAAAPGGTVWVTTDITHESWLRRHFPWMAPTALLVICVLLIEVLWPANQVLPLSQTAVGSGARNRQEEGQGPSRNLAGSAPRPENDSVRRSLETGSKTSGPALAETRRQSTTDSVRAPDAGPVLPAAVESSEEGTKIADRHRSGGLIHGRTGIDDAQGPTPPVAEASADVIVVEPGDEGNSQRSYDSLRAAVRDAASGDVIELRFNGRRSETPFKLINKRLTIRAGKGFRPYVVFRLESDDVYPGRSSQSMVSLLGGDLTLVNIHLEMEVPRGTTSESVSLLETRGAESVHLDRCWLTVINEHDYEGVAFLDVKGAPGGEATSLGPEQTAERPVKIRLENCVARGEATLVHSAEMQPIDLFWRNGFLATSQRFLELDTGRLGHHASGKLQVDLQYVTAIVQGGFMLVDGGEVGRSVPVEVAVRDSILVGDRLSPLIELHGAGRSALLRRSIVWQGDRNFYEGFRDFWLLQDAGEERPLHIDFEEWAEAWKADRYGHDNRPHDGMVVWQSLPPADALPHRFTPDDFLLLDDVLGNPARGAAGDGSDAGFRRELWPPDHGNGS
ncbi:MAG: serine/threonine protein kinase, partial [Pirellulales bacterium]